MSARFAVVVATDPGHYVVMGSYRWRWMADVIARSTKKVIARRVPPGIWVVSVRLAGPPALGEAFRARVAGQ